MTDLLARLKDALADRYAIERELGQGGMATVYLAEDLTHHRPVALKVLRPDLAAVCWSADEFVRQLAIATRVSHPHILPLRDAGEAVGLFYYVQPHVGGESLGDRLAGAKRLPVEEAVGITCDVAVALTCAHAAGLLHGDIRPEQVLLRGGRALLSDFGVRRALGVMAQRADVGIPFGRAEYLCPEAAMARRDVGAPSEQYALACLLFETLIGEPPFSAASPMDLMLKILKDPVPSARTLRPDIPEAVDAALVRALSKEAANRFGSAAEFAAALAWGTAAGDA